MQRYKTIQLLKDNGDPPDRTDPFKWFIYYYCDYLKKELGRIIDKKSTEIKPEDFRAIDDVNKWYLSLNSEIDRNFFRDLNKFKEQIEQEQGKKKKKQGGSEKIPKSEKKRNDERTYLQYLIEKRDKCISELNKSAFKQGSVRTFICNTFLKINDENDKIKGTAKFRIGVIGPFGLRIYVKYEWSPIEIEDLTDFLTSDIGVGEWNGCGSNHIETVNFSKELINRLNKLKEIKPKDLSKVYDIPKAIYKDKTFYVKESDKNKRIQNTSYLTYHRNVIPFNLDEIRVDKTLTEAKEIEVACPDTGEVTTKIVYPELEKEIKNLGRIGKVLGELLPDRRDYINYCEFAKQTYCNIKSDLTRIVILLGTTNDGKSTLQGLMFRISPDIWGRGKFHLIFSPDEKTSGEGYDLHKDKHGIWDDEINTNALLDATRGKENTRSKTRTSELKYGKHTHEDNRQNIIGNCNNPPKWSESGAPMNNRLLYLQCKPTIKDPKYEKDDGEYYKTFSPKEEKAFLKHILQVGGVRLFQGKLGYSENQASIDRINEFASDFISVAFSDLKVTERSASEKVPICRKTVLEMVLFNYSTENNWELEVKEIKRIVRNDLKNKFSRNVVGDSKSIKKRINGVGNATSDYVYIDIKDQYSFLQYAYKDEEKKNLRTYYNLDGSVNYTELINPDAGKQTKSV